ncbi:MAG: hypothetical protein H0U76_08670 [Ktedonobacteraceae bacterium]|nr:hypothetical protein [Ktedonobacteraceae bacterium]
MDEYTTIHERPAAFPSLCIWLCGPFQMAWIDPATGQTVSAVDPRSGGRDRAAAISLLALLLCQPHRQAHRDWVMEQFWPEGRWGVAVHRLENIFSCLRGLLRPPGGGESLVRSVTGKKTGGSSYCLDAYPALWVDMDAFTWNVEQAARMERFGENPLPFWQRASTLFQRGPFLANATYDPYATWITEQRSRLEGYGRQCVHALARLYLASSGQAGTAEALVLLRTYWQSHKTDEDALRPLMEILGEQERYQEAEEYYQQLLVALADLEPDDEGQARMPDPRTQDIREYLRTKQIRRESKPPSSPLFQGVHLNGRDLPASLLAPVVQSLQAQDITIPERVIGGQASWMLSEYGVLVPPSPSMQGLPLAEGTDGNCTAWFSERLALIIAFITQWRNQLGCIAFQKMLDRELHVFDEIKAMFDADAYFLSRRSALLVIAALPTGLLGLLQQQKTAFIEEEFLPACAASIASCWYLLNGRDFASVERALSRYMLFLIGWARQASTYQRTAAYLAAQACLLLGFIELHRLQFQQRIVYCSEAVKYAREAEDNPLLVKALTQLGNAYYDQGVYTKMLQAYQEAQHFMKDVPRSLQSKVFMGLAHAYAQHGQATEALDTINQARQIFPGEIEDVPTFLSADDGEYSLILFEGWIRLDLGKHFPDKDYNEQAAKALAQIDDVPTSTPIPERYRHEIINRRAQAAIAAGKLDMFRDYTLQSSQILQVMHSGKRRQELVINYKTALKKWPHESRVVELADVVL